MLNESTFLSADGRRRWKTRKRGGGGCSCLRARCRSRSRDGSPSGSRRNSRPPSEACVDVCTHIRERHP